MKNPYDRADFFGEKSCRLEIRMIVRICFLHGPFVL